LEWSVILEIVTTTCRCFNTFRPECILSVKLALLPPFL